MKLTTVVFMMVIGLFSELASAPRQIPTSPSNPCPEVRQAIDDSLKIKPGMTRQEVEKLFEEDGGATTRGQTRYLYKPCMYIQIEITFKLATPRNSLDPSPNDTVIKASEPYLAYPTMD